VHGIIVVPVMVLSGGVEARCDQGSRGEAVQGEESEQKRAQSPLQSHDSSLIKHQFKTG
jgi:hypothetical protein